MYSSHFADEQVSSNVAQIIQLGSGTESDHWLGCLNKGGQPSTLCKSCPELSTAPAFRDPKCWDLAKPGLLTQTVHQQGGCRALCGLELGKASSKRGYLSWVLSKELYKEESKEGGEHSKDKEDNEKGPKE